MKKLQKINQNRNIKVLPGGQIEANGQPSGLTALFPQESARADEFAQKYHPDKLLTPANAHLSARLVVYIGVSAHLLHEGAVLAAHECMTVGIGQSCFGALPPDDLRADIQRISANSGQLTEILEERAEWRRPALINCARHSPVNSLSPNSLAYTLRIGVDLCGLNPDFARDWLTAQMEAYAQELGPHDPRRGTLPPPPPMASKLVTVLF